MRRLFFLFTLIWSLTLLAQKKSPQVAETVEILRMAMINADSAALAGVTARYLSYGHSSGMVDDQATFIANLLSGKSDFVAIELSNQVISAGKQTAVVRHDLFAKTNDGGNPGEVRLKVMLVFEKINGRWLVIARQAVKPPANK